MNTWAGRGWPLRTWWIGSVIGFHTKRYRLSVYVLSTVRFTPERHAPWSAPTLAQTAVCARPWEAARCVLPEGTLPQECSGCMPRKQCPAGRAPRRRRRARGAPTAPAWQDPPAPWYAFAWRARRDAAGPHGGRRPRAAEVGSPWPRRITPAHDGTGGR